LAAGRVRIGIMPTVPRRPAAQPERDRRQARQLRGSTRRPTRLSAPSRWCGEPQPGHRRGRGLGSQLDEQTVYRMTRTPGDGACLLRPTFAAIIARVDRIIGAKGSLMPAEDAKAVIRRWVEAWNAQDLDAAEELLEPEFVRHDANLPDVVGPQAERQLIAGNLAAFPDLHFEIEQLIAEGDLVAARYRVQGTHQGEFLGIPGTGRPVIIQAVESYRLTDGKLAEQWVVMDALGLLQQLGAVPGPG
jgi:steroid delta-isomerase-like uncharacterized protein